MSKRLIAVVISALAVVAFSLGSHLSSASAQSPALPDWVDVPCGSNYQSALDWAFHKELMVGAASGTGRAASPTRSLSRAEAVVILHRLAGNPAPAAAHTFTDMDTPGLGFAQTAVSWGSSTGIVKGRTTTTFAPTADISRAAFVTLLHRMAGSPVSASAISFPDMGDADLAWAELQVSWAAATGISQGSFGLFKPRDSVNRAETAIFMRRFAPIVGVDQNVPARLSATDGCVRPPCHPAYAPCLPNRDGDVIDCGDLTAAQKPVTVLVIGVDPYVLDGDNNGAGCVS
jgi:hypothetical protein